MNAFTKKPDISNWVKEQRIKQTQVKNGVKSSTEYSARFNYQISDSNKSKKKSK